MITESELSHSAALPDTSSEHLLRDFVSRGLVILSPERLGIPAEVHEQVYLQEKEAYLAATPVTPSSIPGVIEVLNAPGLVAACDQLVGENWAIVPFTHNASFTSGPRDQHWHKDDNGPYNGRKQRHHQAVQIEMLYFPQEVRADMGPTATIPYSQYWTFNHEENHDNFAGADHLDFDYQISGMERELVSGPESKYDLDDIVCRRTAHDVRMREAVVQTGWPLVRQFEVAPLRAGSIVLYSHNTFHRGNHRRDDWRTWDDNPRFMWRFWLYRTTDPVNSEAAVDEPAWNQIGIDALTGIDLSQTSDDVTTVWDYHHRWIQSGMQPASRTIDTADAEDLCAQLHAKGDDAEPTRIGAAYRLASMSDRASAVELLEKALYVERESVRRAATYGLVAVGPDATDVFLRATASLIKWVRKAGVYGIGDASSLTEQVLYAVVRLLENDPSIYVRSVAAGTLGCLGRRAVATGVGASLIPSCLQALMGSLEREENRLSMNLAQDRSIKFVRPSDESDVCEGMGIDLGLDRFDPVRSAVRENVLWSVVILCSHGGEVLGSALALVVHGLRQVMREDRNVFCVGFAMDALNRLAHLHAKRESPLIADLRNELTEILRESSVLSWEALIRAGLDNASLTQFKKDAP